ncbi:DUF418 domain-containing protein [Bacillus horti]|uniref:DUF418 domain-containing protein n=1 Tax=Caldalkalibacillus horti TaxID=77523 RepID=A0ABT9W5F6_9BACI|nr:DUF418 domain-containing protein [Bacillus horti]MDQ0168479.1 uncharacterized protein [Bacillus horti]
MGRIRILDVLRGLAIIGTLGTNIWIFATLGDIDFLFGETFEWWTTAETIASTLFVFFTNGKFLGMLTILFGVGLELKRQKHERLGTPWLGVYMWSAILLFIDGFIHFLLVFEYDILMSYAITAIIVAWLLQRGPKWTKRVGYTLATLHVIGVALLSLLLAFLLNDPEGLREFQNILVASTELYLHGTWWEQVTYRFQGFWSLRGEAIGVIPMNICLFLVGVWFVRLGMFGVDDRGKTLRRKLLIWGLALGLPLNALVLIPNGYFEMAVRYLFAPILSLGYIGLVSLCMEKSFFTFTFRRFEEIGRMALSCYILQNIVASIMFYGWGFGLGQYSNTWLILEGWLFISLLMMVFAHFWLRRFRSGPVEYVWRKMAAWPMKKT